MASKKHRYRLSDKCKSNTLSLEGSHLTKEWIYLEKKLLKLEKHIKTKDNANGLVEYELYVKKAKPIVPKITPKPKELPK